jgi:hypothetical protein
MDWPAARPHGAHDREAGGAPARPSRKSAPRLRRLPGDQREFVFAAAVVSLMNLPCPAAAQALSAQSDAQDARTDAILAMPNLSTPAPLSNLYSTAPGLEQAIPAPQWRFNFVAPFGFNSNAEEIAHGGTQTFEFGPLANLSWAAPLGALPLRLTLNAFTDSDRFSQAPDAEIDRIGGSARLQYVDPNNDQAFSPYFAFTQRWDFAPTFSDQISQRQDFNLGFNKRFNFDGDFRRVASSGDSSASTVWSFGLTVFAQRRIREPQLSSSAVFVIPSVSYVISNDWSASLAVELMGRRHDMDSFGFGGRNWEALPIATVEYAIPASFFGGERLANILGRPTLDFQTSYLRNWSNAPGASFNQWDGAVAIKTGWRF